MINAQLFINAIEMLEEEKNIPASVIKEALEEALDSAYRREFDPEANIRTEIDMKAATIRLFNVKNIVAEVDDDLTEVDIKDAKKLNKNYKVGDIIEDEVDINEDFTRLAALQVKQVVRQKIREVEKKNIFIEWSGKINEMVTALVERVEGTYSIVAIGNTFGFLASSQIPSNVHLEPGDRIKVLVTEVKEDSKGAPIMVTLKDAMIVKRMLEAAIPEIYDGTVEVKAMARFAGQRTKIAVSSSVEGVDPVGAIIGEGGERIKPIIAELKGEFIDIVKFEDEKEKLIVNALAPAKVIGVKLFKDDEGTERAVAVVKDDVFTLAIGKLGSNAKVASRLCGLSIDIKSETQAQEEGIEYPINGNAVKPGKAFNKFDDTEFASFDFDGKDELTAVEELFTPNAEFEEEVVTEQDEEIDYDAFEEYYED